MDFLNIFGIMFVIDVENGSRSEGACFVDSFVGFLDTKEISCGERELVER
jgi:hypothetical protein